MKKTFALLLITIIIIISGCSKQEQLSLDDRMKAVIDYKLYSMESQLPEQIQKWLMDSHLSGVDGQYFIYQARNETDEYMYAYVYRKGYSNYEVSYIHNPSDLKGKAKVHVTGTEPDPNNETIVEIKTINDLSTLFILSEESLKDKLE